ncbi:MAG: hypothetical protein KF738_15540 [Burkholderiales bacterium]|nr:hypothetical protein [Burkholderiales bacterium]
MRVLSLLLLLAAATSALADDAGIQRCRAIKDAAARLACYDAIVVGAPAAAPAAARAPAPAAPAAAPAKEQFGFEHKQEILKVEAIESTIPGRFEGWRANENIRLANGQVWQVVDDSRASLWMENPNVRVRRGALGAFYLEIAGTNRSPRVRRLQ